MHIPKTGGTAIEDAAQRSGFAWGRFDRHYDGVNGDGRVRLGFDRFCSALVLLGFTILLRLKSGQKRDPITHLSGVCFCLPVVLWIMSPH
jgi:hypothetical protein